MENFERTTAFWNLTPSKFGFRKKYELGCGVKNQYGIDLVLVIEVTHPFEDGTRIQSVRFLSKNEAKNKYDADDEPVEKKFQQRYIRLLRNLEIHIKL